MANKENKYGVIETAKENEFTCNVCAYKEDSGFCDACLNCFKTDSDMDPNEYYLFKKKIILDK